MMPLFSILQDSLILWTGSTLILGFCIMLFFIVAFLWIGIDFRYVIAITSILGITFSVVGWFPIWINAIIWVLVVGYGLYYLWIWIGEH